MPKPITISYPLLGSSADPAKISATIKGVLGLIATILVGFGVSQVDLNPLLEDISSAIELTLQLFFLAMSIFGGVRKVINKFKK